MISSSTNPKTEDQKDVQFERGNEISACPTVQREEPPPNKFRPELAVNPRVTGYMGTEKGEVPERRSGWRGNGGADKRPTKPIQLRRLFNSKPG